MAHHCGLGAWMTESSFYLRTQNPSQNLTLRRALYLGVLKFWLREKVAMVWFQCEDCGENLRKPKLPNHFGRCSAYKLSCIDCGEIFTQQTVQGHMQCITEAEKYGPKNQARPVQSTQSKETKPKPILDIDVNVGLSTRPPWFCSLCNTTTTSKQTLLLHADGKKHRNKAKAFHASKNENGLPKNNVEANISGTHSPEKKILDNVQEVKAIYKADDEGLPRKKQKIEASDKIESKDMTDGEVIQSNDLRDEVNRKSNNSPQSVRLDHSCDARHNDNKNSSDHKIKWKKMIITVLKSNPERILKLKKLKKLVTKSLQESGVAEPENQLHRMLMDKITSSSRFIIDGKHIHLTKKTKSS